MKEDKKRQEQQDTNRILAGHDENRMVTVVEFFEEKAIADGSDHGTECQQNPHFIESDIGKFGQKHHQNAYHRDEYAGEIDSAQSFFKIKERQKDGENRNGGNDNRNHRGVSELEAVGFAKKIEERLEEAETKQIEPILPGDVAEALTEKKRADHDKQGGGDDHPEKDECDGSDHAQEVLGEHIREAPKADGEEKNDEIAEILSVHSKTQKRECEHSLFRMVSVHFKSGFILQHLEPELGLQWLGDFRVMHRTRVWKGKHIRGRAP